MNLLIVGGVAGGASAAARARRLSEEAHIVLFERGPDVSFANCGLPYYVGGQIAEREKLLVAKGLCIFNFRELLPNGRSGVRSMSRQSWQLQLPTDRFCWTFAHRRNLLPATSLEPRTSPWMTCDLGWANCPATERLPRFAKWDSEATWRPAFCCKPVSPQQMSEAATRRTNSFSRLKRSDRGAARPSDRTMRSTSGRRPMMCVSEGEGIRT